MAMAKPKSPTKRVKESAAPKPTTSPYCKPQGSAIHQQGLFASKKIPKNAEIIEYVGEKISTKEGDRRAIDLADDAGYHGYDYGYGEDNPSPSSSSYYPDADGSEDFDDFEMDSPESSVMAGTGAGVYIQGPIEGATRHGTVCRFPFPACGNNSVGRNRAGSRSPMCV